MSDFTNINAAGLTDEGAYTPDKLFDRNTRTRKATIKSGAGILKRGSLLGKITATGKYVLSTSAAVDGSEVPDVILLEPVDATAADVEAAIAISGDFGIQGITFGAGHTAASVEAACRDKGIYLENVIG